MEAPPVHYATTQDGYKIAYTVCGDGLPIVFMPTWTNHVHEVWSSNAIGWLLSGLAERYRVVNYDARGMGMSTRGLPEDISLESYISDLEAVVEMVGLERFILIGSHSSALLAARYAIRFPGRVAALVLNNSGLAWPGAQIPSLWEEMPRQSWEAFLYSLVPKSYPIEAVTRFREKMAGWILREDYLTALGVWREASLEGIADQVQTPTLVLKPRQCPCARVECSLELAQKLPHGRITLLDGDWAYGEPPQALEAIEAFFSELGLSADTLEGTSSHTSILPAGLSPRQAQVLRLIAEGKTNGEIADELVISLRTVERHVAELYAKIGARNRVEAAAFAMSRFVKA